jgi:hypothetical protein
LKEQLAKEQRDHAEAISDVERNAVQERERLKKEIQTRVEETKLQMTRLMEEQLHQVYKKPCPIFHILLENVIPTPCIHKDLCYPGYMRGGFAMLM